jgi:hypothetical protein
MIKEKILGFALLLFIFSIGINQKIVCQEYDNGFWSSMEVSKKINKKISVSLEEEFRLRNNLKTTDKFMTTLGLDYKINKFFDIGISDCFINYYHPGNKKHDYKNYWENKNRINLYGEGDYTLGRFSFSLRERLQSTYTFLDSISNQEINPELILRSKLSVSYNIPKIPVEPYASVENFLPLDGSYKYTTEEMRFAFGLKYNISKKLALKVGYVYSREYQEDVEADDDEITNVLSFDISVKI